MKRDHHRALQMTSPGGVGRTLTMYSLPYHAARISGMKLSIRLASMLFVSSIFVMMIGFFWWNNFRYKFESKLSVVYYELAESMLLFGIILVISFLILSANIIYRKNWLRGLRMPALCLAYCAITGPLQAGFYPNVDYAEQTRLEKVISEIVVDLTIITAFVLYIRNWIVYRDTFYIAVLLVVAAVLTEYISSVWIIYESDVKSWLGLPGPLK